MKYGYSIEKHNINGVDINFAKWNHPAIGSGNMFGTTSINFIRSILKNGDVAIDIGTHVGAETVLYALTVGDSGKIFAFEPNPMCYEPFSKTCELNPFLRIIPNNLAITEDCGSFIFHYSDDGYCNGGFASKTSSGIGACGHFFPMEVKGVNLEDWLINNATECEIERIQFIKVDTEGYDLKILKSIVNLINKLRPTIQSEIFLMSNENDVREHIEFFEGIEYNSYLFPEIKQEVVEIFNQYQINEPPLRSTNFKKLHHIVKTIGCASNILSIPREKCIP